MTVYFPELKHKIIEDIVFKRNSKITIYQLGKLDRN